MKIIIKITIIGEISIGPNRLPINFLIGYSTGSVALCRNLTTGLYGSGLTQVTKAANITTHLYNPRSIITSSIKELKKSWKIDI